MPAKGSSSRASAPAGPHWFIGLPSIRSSRFRHSGQPCRLLSKTFDSGPAWLDASGGENGDPKSKIDYFANTIRNNTSLRPKLAFMKFCYVDFNPHTNVDELFAYYARVSPDRRKEHRRRDFRA